MGGRWVGSVEVYLGEERSVVELQRCYEILVRSNDKTGCLM